MTDEEDVPDRQFLPRDIGQERASFEASEAAKKPDYRFVALAIGAWASGKTPSKNPPKWALDACVALRERAEMASRPIIGRAPGPNVSEADNAALEHVADLMIDWECKKAAGLAVKLSVRKAIRHTLKLGPLDPDNADYRRLARLWSKDATHRVERANLRVAQKLRQRGMLK